MENINLNKSIEEVLAAKYSQVKVISDDGVHFKVIIRDSFFNDKSLIESHRAVYQSLGDLMQEIHALSIDVKGLD